MHSNLAKNQDGILGYKDTFLLCQQYQNLQYEAVNTEEEYEVFN